MLMKRVWGHVLTGLSLLTVGAVAFAAACVHDDSTIFIQDVLAPQEVSNNQPCIFTSSTTQAVLPSGVLDIDFRYQYDPTYLVGNQMVQEQNTQQLMTETSTVNIQGAVVRITDSGGAQLTTFTRLAAGTLYPSTGGVPGYAPISVTTIDRDTILNNSTIQSTVINAARPGVVRLVTYVRFFGKTLGGKYVESNEFEFPVDVCKGCLITFSPQDIYMDPTGHIPVPNCLGSGAGSSAAQQSLPCVVGQDLQIDCIQCLNVPDCHGAYQGGIIQDAGGGG
jgi:hypothetical protein